MMLQPRANNKERTSPMIKEVYEKLKAKLVLFDLEEVYMLELQSKSDGEDFPFPGDEWDDDL